MGKDTAHTRTLRRAVEALGSPEELAETLGVSPENLAAWLAGDQALPNEVYMRAQCEQVFKNLTNVLRAAGAGWNDVIKMNGYMVGINAENVAAYREVRSGYLKAKELPASTLVGVTSLVQPELLLEIEVVAALGN